MPFLAVLLLIPVFALISWLVNRLLLQKIGRHGMEKPLQPAHLRWSAGAKPLTGGLGMAISLLPAVIFFMSQQTEIPVWQMFALSGFLLTATLTGWIDDLWHLNPPAKLLGQFIAAGIACLGGWDLHWFGLQIPDLLLSLLLIMGLLNSLNMLDNIDGVTAMSAFALCAAAVLGASFSISWIGIILAFMGVLMGFLHLNLYPSRIFMGDAGSHLLGAMVFLIIRLQWASATPDLAGTCILVYGMAFIPLTDTLVVTGSRLLRKKSPFIGGKDHLTHMLVYSGIRQSALPWILGLIHFFAALLVISSDLSRSAQLLVLTLLLSGFIWMYYRTWKRRLVPENQLP